MLRFVGAVVRGLQRVNVGANVKLIVEPKLYIQNVVQTRSFQICSRPTIIERVNETKLLSMPTGDTLLPTCQPMCIQSRTLTKFSLQKGKRKTVKTVLKRFKRLHWGAWIRTIAGRNKSIWKKSYRRKIRSRQHVFCNATQSWLLDTMVTAYWRRPRFYVNDPYTPYHKREEFYLTKKKPSP